MATVTTDTLVTEFKRVGDTALLRALNNIAAAYDKIAKAQAKVANHPPITPPNVPVPGGGGAGGTGAGGWAAWFSNQLGGGKLGGSAIKQVGIDIAGSSTALEGFAATAAAAVGPMVAIGAAIAGVGIASYGAEKRLIEYGNAVMDLRDISGESASEAAKAVAIFNAAGVSEVQEIRGLLKGVKDLFSNNGTRGFGLVPGLNLSSNDTPLQILDKYTTAIHNMNGGLLKAESLTEAWGARNAKIILQLARMTEEQKKLAIENSFGVTDQDLAKIQDMGVQFNILQQSFLSKVVYPIAELLMPALKTGIKLIEEMVDGFQGLAGLKDSLAWVIEWAEKLAFYLNPIFWLFKALGAIPHDNANSVQTGTESMSNSMSSLKNSIDRNTDAQIISNQQLSRLTNGGIPSALSNWDINTLATNMQLEALS